MMNEGRYEAKIGKVVRKALLVSGCAYACAAGSMASAQAAASQSQSQSDESAPTASKPVQSRSGTAPTSNNQSQPQAGAAPDSQEIVVTAEKRSENLRNVPASVQVITGDRLQTLKVSSLADLQGFVPSLTLSNYGAPGANTLEIRGLGDNYLSDAAGPLVTTYVDDFAIGSSTSAGRGNLFGLDLIPYDIDRVELLAGPQGTLYGAGAMGGLIKYQLKQPSLRQFSGGLGGDIAHEGDSDAADYQARAFLNVPVVTDQLAVRISGFEKRDAGYIDNIGIGKKDSNSSSEKGGRIAVLWAPTDKLKLKANVLLQDINAADLTNVILNGSTGQPLYGRYITNTHFAQPLKQKTRYYTFGGSYDLGFADLSSVVGWSKLNTGLDQDFTVPYASFTGVPGALAMWQIRAHVAKFSEETRLTSKGDGRLSWIVGQFYTRENAGEDDSLPTFTSSHVPLPASDNVLILHNDSVYREISFFGNLTYKLTDQFDVTAGGRWTHYKQSLNGSSGGIFGGGLEPEAKISGNVGTWMANARYHIDQDQMLYARVATGFRPGTPNPPLPGVPLVSKPDRTTDYEIGYKASLDQHRFQATLAAFHINWTDIQEAAFTPVGLEYIANSSRAASDGFEVSTSYLVTPDLTIGLNGAYTNARLTADAPTVSGHKGDQLPLSAKFVGSASIDYSHMINSRLTVFAGASYRHKGRVVSQFEGTGNPLPLGPQNIVNAYAGGTLGDWSLRLYAKNIFNNRSYTGVQFLIDPSEPRAVPVQPRTVGLSLDYRFR